MSNHPLPPVSASACMHRAGRAGLALALLALATTSPLHAAEVQVGVRISAMDIGYDTVILSDGGFAGPVQGTVPRTSFFVQGSSGVVLSSSFMQADALTGQMRGNLLSSVSSGDTTPRPGRGGSATGTASMTGSITLAGSAPPGLATFAGIFEGAYNFGTANTRYNNSASVEGYGIVGDVYQGINRIDFNAFTGAGLFGVPLSWTVAVQPGQRLDMSFYMRAALISVVGITTIDIGNTFKLTSISLPAGYTYAPDAQGFLSQFVPSVVPEPTSGTLLLAGLGGVAGLLRRLRRSVQT